MMYESKRFTVPAVGRAPEVINILGAPGVGGPCINNAAAYMRDLAFWLHGPTGGFDLLLMLRVLADESHDERQERVMTFAGLLASSGNWTKFWEAWAGALMEPQFGVRPFHAADCDSAQGDFAGWDAERVEALQRRLIALVVSPEFNIVGYSISFPLGPYADLRDVVRSFYYIPSGDTGGVSGRLDDPWFVGMSTLIAAIIDDPRPIIPPNEKVGFVFDRHHLKARGEVIYNVLADEGHPRLEVGGIAFEDKSVLVPLQAADLFAYETFRYRHDTGLDGRPERWQHRELRPMMAASFWVDQPGLEAIIGGAKRDFDVAVPNPLPIQRREAKVPYKATLRSRIRGWLKRRARAVRKSLRNQ